MDLYSKYTCLCGFKNTIKFKQPTLRSLSWLMSECLSCGTKYDIRVYPIEGSATYQIYKKPLNQPDMVDLEKIK